MQWIRSHLSFANAISMIALFVALGGTSIAAVSLSKNSVGAKQIKKNAVRASEITRNAVGASEIRSNAVAGGDVADGTIGGGDIGDESLGASDLGNDSVGNGELADNSVGSGEVIDGSLGKTDLAPGLLDRNVTVQFEQAAAALADNASASYDVHCPAGQQAIAGGSRGDLTDSEYTITTSSRPIISTTNAGAPGDDGTFTGWRATVLNPTGAPGGAFVNPPPGGAILPEVWVICMTQP
jgi:hypothetical protein